MDDLIISVFYEIDNFCKEFILIWNNNAYRLVTARSLELPSVFTL